KFSRVHPTRNDHIPTRNTRKGVGSDGYEPPVAGTGGPGVMTSRTTDGITDPVYRPVDGGAVAITMTITRKRI
ncbi:MAG TPA: hypothetical protein PKC67_15790, partial [Kiritimatiellia bacterium]|nr:hypothetical protein [Kiritimatiellia bacterium]HMP35797.1 hypothetical protein [Kiritimatiellia bacterium]